MRKAKPIAGRIPSVSVRPLAARPIEDGVMAQPIPPERREQAHEEMRNYIERRSLSSSKTVPTN